MSTVDLRSLSKDAYILVAPSGVGKSTLIFRLLEDHPDQLALSCSHTTRSPRKGEVDGVHYHFVSQEEFLSLTREDVFLEWAKVHRDYYGTSHKEMAKLRDGGKKVLIEVDIQGLASIKKCEPYFRSVFILPPSLKVMRKRLVDRSTDDPDGLLARFRSAQDEFDRAHLCDYYIINQDLKEAETTLKRWILEGDPPPLPRAEALELAAEILSGIEEMRL